LGTSENAVKTQIWCAIATYVLIAIVKKELQLDASLYTCLQILSVSVFEKTELAYALQPSRSPPDSDLAANQLILFGF
ncbi:MAG: IS4 family transposase, partial [Rhodanobacteraceae bacterium]